LQKRYSITNGMPNWGQGKSVGATPQMMTPAAPIGNFDPATGDFMGKSGAPALGGDWMKGANLALGGAQVGLGVWNALEQSKMNKFMRGYYGEEMARNKADFANNALVTNNQIEQQARNRASNAGFGFDSEESKKRTASHMDQWGVKGTFA